MYNKLLENQTYYFVNKEIVIISQWESFNLAIVRYANSIKEFVVDINFIELKPSTESFISIKDLRGSDKNDT